LAYKVTGVSMASANDTPDQIEVVNKWPGMQETRDKVPSIIAYDDNSHSWGYEVSPTMVSSSWFKLGMTESGIPAARDDPLLIQSVGKGLLRIPEGKTAEDLCRDYLTNLYQYVINRLVRQFTKSVIDVTPIKFVLTAPADWGERYKHKLITAATAAGVSSRSQDSISIIDEPEAAALAAFEASQRFKLGLFKVKLPP
jgi:molecular chaperone DnaK (HSP70)